MPVYKFVGRPFLFPKNTGHFYKSVILLNLVRLKNVKQPLYCGFNNIFILFSPLRAHYHYVWPWIIA